MLAFGQSGDFHLQTLFSRDHGDFAPYMTLVCAYACAERTLACARACARA